MIGSYRSCGSPRRLPGSAFCYLFLLSTIAGILTVTAFAEPLPESDPNSLGYGWTHNHGSTSAKSSDSSSFDYDVVIYGSTPAAITAAVQVQNMGHTVAIVCPEQHIGGMTSSGLGWTDSKGSAAIGGLARDFYGDVYTYYLNNSVWNYETREQYVAKKVAAQPGVSPDGTRALQWTFEPHVAEAIYEQWLSQRNITVFRGEYVSRNSSGVSLTSGKIDSFKTESGKVFSAKQFIDAGYEGDLMASSGITYQIGRDAHNLYKESLAGIILNNGNSISTGMGSAYDGVDPFNTKGKAESGLLHGIEVSYDELPNDFTGASDHFRVQSYLYRLTLTRNATNKVKFLKPSNYNESEYELLVRYYEAGHTDGFTVQAMPNAKTDSNSNGQVSFDFLGGNYDFESDPPISYSEATYDQRKGFIQSHIDYQQGVLWTLSNHPRIPAKQRKYFNEWGLSKDEYTDNSNWPYQLYIREARRMQGAHILTQQDVQNSAGYLGDAIAGFGSYSMDSHPIRRVVLGGKIYDEGHFYVQNPRPYAIPLKSIMPKKGEATNFLNPVTVSATHVAFGSLRMEPTYMTLGQSAGIAASLAIQNNCAVQDVDRKSFMKQMTRYKQIVNVECKESCRECVKSSGIKTGCKCTADQIWEPGELVTICLDPKAWTMMWNGPKGFTHHSIPH